MSTLCVDNIKETRQKKVSIQVCEPDTSTPRHDLNLNLNLNF